MPHEPRHPYQGGRSDYLVRQRAEIEDPEKPKGVRKAQLWLELQRLLKLKCAGTAWPESVLDRGITNLETL